MGRVARLDGPMMTVTFGCGHTLQIDETVDAPPRCVCGETRVTNVTTRPPTFQGTCHGPLVKVN